MTDNYCIALQPICDRKMRHVADELLYRSNATAQSAVFSDAMVATARASNIAFYEIGLEKLVGERKVFLNAPRDWLLSPELLPPKSSQIVIEILETVVAEPEIIKALAYIKSRGYLIALDDFVLNDNTKQLLQYADYVKIDRWQNMSLEECAFYKNKKIKLLAEKVETYEDFQLLRQKGFDYFQGYFYARPITQTGLAYDRVSNRQAQLRLLAELQHEQVDYDKLETLILLDPHLTYIILKYTNSAFYALQAPSTSMQHALQVLGLRRVRAIIATQLFATAQTASALLLPQVLTRAAMCEHLAEVQGLEAHTAFIAGLLSKMHTIFDVPYAELLNQLCLPVEIVLQLEGRKGKYGRLLDMIEGFENGDMTKLSFEEVSRLNQVWLDSRVWVQEVLEHTTESDKG